MAAERKLQALKVQLDDTPSSAIERASQQRYRMVKFFGTLRLPSGVVWLT